MKFLRCNTICSLLIPVSVILLSQSVMASWLRLAQESPDSPRPFLEDKTLMALALELASDYGECPVCMEPLYKSTPIVFTTQEYREGDRVEVYKLNDEKWHPATYKSKADRFFRDTYHYIMNYDDDNPREISLVEDKELRGCITKRSCRHFACQDCANYIAGTTDSKCPFCRAKYTGCLAIPDLFQDPKAWFATIDFDGDKALSRPEITDVLKCYFKVDSKNPNAVEQYLEKNWPKWDLDGNETICLSEFMEHLLPFLKETHKALDNMKDYSEIPNWRQNPDAWFDFWDYDKSGELEKPEVVRALAKTLKGVSVEVICTILEALWGDFDPNGDGGISKDEFVKRDGLYEMLMDNPLEEQAAASPRPSASPARPAHLRSLPRGWEELTNSDGETVFRNVRTRVIHPHRPTKDDIEEDKKTNDDNRNTMETWLQKNYY